MNRRSFLKAGAALAASAALPAAAEAPWWEYGYTGYDVLKITDGEAAAWRVIAGGRFELSGPLKISPRSLVTCCTFIAKPGYEGPMFEEGGEDVCIINSEFTFNRTA